MEFYEEAYSEPERLYPSYNNIYALAGSYAKAINHTEPLFFQWLKPEQIDRAKAFDWPSIESIPNPPYYGPVQPLAEDEPPDANLPIRSASFISELIRVISAKYTLNQR